MGKQINPEKQIKTNLNSFSKSEIRLLRNLGMIFEAMYFDIEKSILHSKLDYENTEPSMINGWGISFNDNTNGLVFKKYYSVDQPLEVSQSEYKLYGVNDQLLNRPMLRSDFFPNVENQMLGMYFLNYGEFDIATTQNEPVDFYRFSLALISLGSRHLSNDSLPSLMPIIKIELKKLPSDTIPYSTLGSPTILLAPPCPPVWRPGIITGISNQNEGR